MHQSAQKGPGGQDNRTRAEPDAELGHHPGNPVLLQPEIIHRLLEQGQIGLSLQPRPNRLAIKNSVRLGPGRTNGRSLSGIENAKLYARLVGSQCHGTAQSVHFLDQMSLTDSPN